MILSMVWSSLFSIRWISDSVTSLKYNLKKRQNWFSMSIKSQLLYGGERGSSVRRACNSRWAGLEFDPRCGCPLPYWLSRCQYSVTGWDWSHGLPALSCVWQPVKLSHVSLVTHPRYSVIVKKSTKQKTFIQRYTDRWSYPLCLFSYSVCSSSNFKIKLTLQIKKLISSGITETKTKIYKNQLCFFLTN